MMTTDAHQRTALRTNQPFMIAIHQTLKKPSRTGQSGGPFMFISG